jgi:hypothetical protein
VAGNNNYPRRCRHVGVVTQPAKVAGNNNYPRLSSTTTNGHITRTVQRVKENGDVQAWQTLSDKAVRRQIELEQELARVAGKSIDWNSPEQMFEMLRHRGPYG